MVLPAVSAESVERPIRLANGSITVPLPEENGRKRPPTVEFPTIESEMIDTPAVDRPRNGRPLALQGPASAPASKPLPSIFSVIDRGRAPLETAPPAVASMAAPPAPSSRVDRDAVPEPIIHETAAATDQGRALTDPRAPEPSPVRMAVRPGPTRAASARPKRPGSFSDAERAFFAAGEELERVDQHSLADDDLDDLATARRPTLWRRLTGRRGSL
jgi:hypothetical protein